MRAFVNDYGDISTATDPGAPVPDGSREVAVPEGVIRDALIWDGTNLIDRAKISTWWVDGHGTRRAFKGDPSWTQFDAAWDAPAPLTQPQMRDALMTAASSACDAITAQIIPDATHQQAYDKAAIYVAANGGAAPKDDPLKTAFANLGASVGVPKPDTFAKVVTAVSLASIELATILATLRASAGSAKSAADLSGALDAFETSVGDFVTRLNAAGLATPVQVPPAIAIPGL